MNQPLHAAVLNEERAAAYLDLSRSSLRKSRMNGARAAYAPVVPWVQIGRRVVYRLVDLEMYLRRNRRPSIDEEALVTAKSFPHTLNRQSVRQVDPADDDGDEFEGDDENDDQGADDE